ncbi:MAG: DNA polymerase IV, partial [Slackia sp.]|nr:DNA polymerase IV [Slackia sp.]
TAPESLLVSIWGKNAQMMRDRCLGLDATPVSADDETKSISSEITVSHDLKDFASISATVDTMAAKVGRRLRKKGLRGRTVMLRMRYSDKSSRSIQQKLACPENNEYAFLPILHEMIDALWKPGMSVRLVGVAVTGFKEEEPRQESLFDYSDLFDGDTGNEKKLPKRKPPIDVDSGKRLSNATDIVKNRFGESAVFFGRELHVNENTTGSAAKNPADM